MRALLLAVLVALPLAAPPAGAAAREVELVVGTRADGSMYVDPATVVVDQGDDVTLHIRNVDRIFHDIALLDYDGNDIEIEVPAGRTESHTFKATVAGEFRMICEVSGHKQKGMYGTLTVKGEEEKAGIPGVPLAGLVAVLLAAALAARRPRA